MTDRTNSKAVDGGGMVIPMQDLDGYGRNVKGVKQGNTLILMIDLARDLGLSSTGKSILVASTGGFERVGGGIRVNVVVSKDK